MGVIAYVRQIYLDADHYQLVKDAYAKNPRGMQRPEYDRALEGVIESKRILLPANRWVEIDRMIHFAAELKQPAIYYGIREGFRIGRVKYLKDAHATVLVSLKWPEKAARRRIRRRTNLTGRWMVREKAPTTPAVLAEERDQVRALFRWHRHAARFAKGDQEGHRQRPFARRCAARADAFAGGNLWRAGPAGSDREGEDRQPGGDQGRDFRRSHED